MALEAGVVAAGEGVVVMIGKLQGYKLYATSHVIPSGRQDQRRDAATGLIRRHVIVYPLSP